MSEARSGRVALVGNVANCLLPIGLALREAGVEADLFVDEGAPATYRPEVARPDLAGATWVRYGRWLPAASALLPWRSPLVRALGAYDVIVASGPAPAVAQFAGRPVCWWVSGADLTVTPFPWAFRSIHIGWLRKLGAYPLAFWQRRALRRAAEIWVQPFVPFADAMQRLGLSGPRVSDRYLPLVVDVDDLDPERPSDPLEPVTAIEDRMARADLVVFQPSRILLDPTPSQRRAGQWKGTDVMLRGLHEHVRRGEGEGTLLVLVDLGSRDVAAAEALIRSLDIGDHVLWARPPRVGGFTRPEMRRLYAASHVVADEFAAGWFGFVTLEALSMARPVLSYVDERAMRRLYPDGHPIQSARTPSEIADQLTSLKDPALRAAIGAAGRAWAIAHHSPAGAGAAFVREISGALARAAQHPGG